MALTAELKDQLITNLIAGVEGEGPWTEDDRLALNAIPECKLEALEKQRLLALNAKKANPFAKKKVVDPADDEMEDEMDDGEDEDMETNAGCGSKKMTKNSGGCSDRKPTTLNEFMALAPPEVRSVVANAIKFEKNQKAQLVKTITANARNVFTADYLNGLGIEELQGIAALATNDADSEESLTANQSRRGNILLPHYSGIPGVTRQLTENFSQEDLDMAAFDDEAVSVADVSDDE